MRIRRIPDISGVVITTNLDDDSGDPIIAKFLKQVREDRKEVFRYLYDPMVKRTTNVAEQHFSMRTELLKRRFKTNDRMIRTCY